MRYQNDGGGGYSIRLEGYLKHRENVYYLLEHRDNATIYQQFKYIHKSSLSLHLSV